MNKKFFLLIVVLFLSVLVGCSEPVDPPPKPLAEIMVVPDKDNLQYSINSYDSSYSVVDEKSELKGSASIKYGKSSPKSHIWIQIDGNYYSIYIRPIPKIDSINIPFIKKTIWDSGPHFMNNSDGSISFPKASLKADFTGVVSISGTCVAYGDDYKFNSSFNVLKGQLKNISITSTNWNRFENTTVRCSWAVGVDSVNGAHSSLEFW